jgi:hypothetical protein
VTYRGMQALSYSNLVIIMPPLMGDILAPSEFSVVACIFSMLYGKSRSVFYWVSM